MWRMIALAFLVETAIVGTAVAQPPDVYSRGSMQVVCIDRAELVAVINAAVRGGTTGMLAALKKSRQCVVGRMTATFKTIGAQQVTKAELGGQTVCLWTVWIESIRSGNRIWLLWIGRPAPAV